MPQALEAAQKEVPGGKLLEVDLEMGAAEPTYSLSLLADKQKKEVLIDAVGGKVLKVETEEAEEGEESEAADAAKAVAGAKVGLLQAIEAAVKEVKGGQVYFAELTLQDGKPRYDVSLLAGKKCFEAIVDAADGKVLKSSEIKPEQGWRKTFKVDKAKLSDTGRGTFFILEPGYVLHYKDGKDNLTISVLDQTRMVDGVKTRVIEEREEKNGQLEEVSRNYFAIDNATGDVYYFGEEVDMYKNGKITSHEGAWLSGEDGATFGLAMPGHPKVGDKYYQEVAPEKAMDRAENISLDETMKTPAGNFEKCLHVKETTPLERDISHKWYAPGVGLLKDGGFLLTGVDKPKAAASAPAKEAK